jgi:hypothetical protein
MASAAPSSCLHDRARRCLLIAAALVAVGAHPGSAWAGLPTPTPTTPVVAPTQPTSTVTTTVQSATAPVSSSLPSAPVAPATPSVPAPAAPAPVAKAVEQATRAASAVTAPVTTAARVTRSLPRPTKVVAEAAGTVKQLDSVASANVEAGAAAVARTARTVGASSHGTAPATSRNALPKPAAPVGHVRQPHRPQALLDQRGPVELLTPAHVSTDRVQPATTAPRAPAAPDREGPGPLPGPTQGPASSVAPTAATGAAVLAALLLGFVLAIPNAGRWLRPALALGLSPVTVLPADRPG